MCVAGCTRPPDVADVVDDWVRDITAAKAANLSGFALNTGVDPYTDTQLGYAYQAARSIGKFSLALSFDFVRGRLLSDIALRRRSRCACTQT